MIPLDDLGPFSRAVRGLGRPTDLILFVDNGPSMRAWAPTVTAFREVIQACQAFDYVDVRSFDRAGGTHSRPDSVSLILTDGLGEVWRRRTGMDLLRSLGTIMPLAVMNPYPQRYWRRTGLPMRHMQLSAPRPFCPNGELEWQEPERLRNPFDEPLPTGCVPVPMLELEARWLEWWIRLLRGGSSEMLDALALSPFEDGPVGGPDSGEPAAAPPSEPADLVLRFRAEASALAFRLATLVAAAPLELAFLRSIQKDLLPASGPLHLAEVITSSLLMAPGHDLAFREGVREALLACSTRTDVVRVIETLASHFGDRNPPIQALSQALEAPDEESDTQVNTQSLPLARLELSILRALSGPYSLRALRLSRSVAEFDRPQPTLPGSHVESGGIMTTPSSTPSPIIEPAQTADVLPSASGQETPRRDTIWGNVPPRNGDFTGRAELLDELEHRLHTDRVTAVLPHALHGMGGVGKSQMATEYAYLHRGDYDVIWWISAEQPAEIKRALIDLGKRLGVDEGLDANIAVRRVQEKLRAGSPYPNWLLIFDNAETLETVQPYFPEQGTGKVIVTSRNPEWSDIAHSLEIDVFTRAESVELLRKRDPEVTLEEANDMAAALGDLPLAVDQASAWRAITKMPVARYLQLLADKRAELAGQEAPSGYEMPVAVAWNVALDRLGTENPGALQLLQVCSFFAPEPILLELFTSPRTAPISPDLDRTLQSPSRLNRAIRDIQRYRLARIDHRESPTIQIHRLVKTVLVSRLTTEQREEMEHGAHVLLAGGNPGSPDKTPQWPRYHALLPHVLSSDAVSCDDPWARQMVLHVIEFLYYWGDHAGCRNLAGQVVSRWREDLGEDDFQTLKAARWLGFVLWFLGEFREAAEINRDTLARLRRTADPDDEETLDAMKLVAADLRAAGEFEAARDLGQQAFEACLHAFGKDDPTTLELAHSLGVCLRMTGEFRRALELDVDTHERRKKVLGEDHALTLWTLNGLSLDLRECGNYLQAHKQQEILYERFQRVWGLDHPNTITAARNLAVARRRAGEHERGRKLAEEIMIRFRDRYGSRHPETIAAALNYAVDLRENDELEASRELAEQTFLDYDSIFGSEHPYTLYARTNLAIVLRIAGEAQASHDHNAAAFESLRRRLGPDHVLTLTCATNLASDHAELGLYEEARGIDADTLERSRARLGEDHPSTLALELNLAFDLIALGRHEEGAQRHDKALAAYRRVLGDDHPAIAAAQARVRANCDVDPMPL